TDYPRVQLAHYSEWFLLRDYFACSSFKKAWVGCRFDLELESHACEESIQARTNLGETSGCVNRDRCNLIPSLSLPRPVLLENYAWPDFEHLLRIIYVSVVPKQIQEARQKPASHSCVSGHLRIHQLDVILVLQAHFVHEDFRRCQAVGQELLVSEPDHDLCQGLMSIRLRC